MSSERRWLSDLVELCEDQGFIVTQLMGGTGVRVMPKTQAHHPITLYYNSASYTERLNRESMLKRIGVKLPSNHTKPKARNVEQGEPVKLVSTQAPTSQTMQIDTTPPPPPDRFEMVRLKINAALDALAEADSALNELEADHRRFQSLKDLLKGM